MHRALSAFENIQFLNSQRCLCSSAQTPSGHITWEELRHILNCVVAKLNDSEFSELKQTFDPEGTGAVRVNSLLDVLDDSTKVGLKQTIPWLGDSRRLEVKCSQQNTV